MSILERTIDSRKLGRTNNIKLWVPDTGKEPYPTVYLQHGLGDNEQTPWERTDLESYAEELELIIVTADAGDSWFVNDERAGESGGGCFWEDYFAFELPACIEEEFPASAVAESRGQCGFSMGGYGAMMLTMLHPDRFSAVSVHSGSYMFGHEYRKDRPERAAFMKAVAPPGSRYDLFMLAADNSVFSESAPAIRFDVGDRDHLLEHNRRFHTYLSDNGIAHSYAENPGAHLWSYVDSYLKESLAFFADNLTV